MPCTRPLSPHRRAERGSGAFGQLIAELSAADVYVFGIPMYNFSVPGVFKSYIDQVVRAGVTFDPATTPACC